MFFWHNYYTKTGNRSYDNSDSSTFHQHNTTVEELMYTQNRSKFAIIGANGCGKTAFIRRLVSNEFTDEVGSSAPFRQVLCIEKTDAIIELIDLGEDQIKIQIKQANENRVASDSCQKFTEFTDLYGVFLLYDITDKNSFNVALKLLSSMLPFTSPTCEIIFIGCKTDRKSERQLPFLDAREKIQTLGYSVIETSAKTGENCTLALTELMKRHYERQVLSEFSPKNSFCQFI